jgi:cytochrome c peroxidase
MKKYIVLLMISGISILIACKQNTKQVEQQVPIDDEALIKMAKSTFGVLPEFANNPNNPLSDAKVALGRFLYFDKQLSKNGNISCNSCHALNNFGVDNQKTSPGDDSIRGERNTPTVFNAALHSTQFWDGRAKDVEEQAGTPILNPIEHGIPDKTFLEKRIKSIEMYKGLFSQAFPDEKEPVSFDNIAKAIAAFERKMITPSRFDKYIAGDIAALNVTEKEGFKLFMETGCNTCHIGPALGGVLFQKFGLYGDYWLETKSEKQDKGRSEITKSETDTYFFKVSGLRNVSKTAPYFHDGSVADLHEAVRIMAKLQLNKDLSAENIDKIVSFLESLTGDIPDTMKENPLAAKQ